MTEKQIDVPFEEALTKTGFGKYNIFMLLVCGFLVTSMVFEGMSMSFLVPASACEMNTTSVQQGIMAGTPLIGVIATSHMWGYLADTRGRRPVLALSLMLGFSVAFISAFSPNWIVFSVLKLISCSAVSGTYALSITLLSESTPVAKRGSLIIFTTGLFMAANGFMSVLAIPILPLEFSYHIPVLNIQFNSWRLLAIVYTLPCLIGAIGIHSIWESPKYLVSSGCQDEAIDILKQIYRINHGTQNSDNYQVESIILGEQTANKDKIGFWASTVRQTIPILKPPLLKSTIILSLFFVAVYLCTNPFYMWLPTIADGFTRAVQAGNTDATLCEMLRITQNATAVFVEEPKKCVFDPFAMSLVLIFAIISSVLNTLIGFITPWYGRKRLLITIQFVAGVCGICINFGTHWILSALLLIAFVSANLNFGVVTTFTVDIYPTYLRAMAVCLTLMVGRISAVIGINIVRGMIVDQCEMSFYIFATLTILGGFVALLLPSDKKLQKPNQLEDK